MLNRSSCRRLLACCCRHAQPLNLQLPLTCPSCFILLAMSMKVWLRSMPITSPYARASSKVDLGCVGTGWRPGWGTGSGTQACHVNWVGRGCMTMFASASPGAEGPFPTVPAVPAAHLPTAQPRSRARPVAAPCLAAQLMTRSPHFLGKSSPSARMPISARKSAKAISRGPKCRDRYLYGQAASQSVRCQGVMWVCIDPQGRQGDAGHTAACARGRHCCCQTAAAAAPQHKLTATSGSRSRSCSWWQPAWRC
jgi:hypothetical protein